MAVAPEVLEAGAGAAREAAAWRAISSASGQVPRAAGGARRAARGAVSSVSSPSAAAQTITKLIWAIALGLIALQVAAEATGQQWAFSLPGRGQKPSKQPYRPLYGPQAASAMPGVIPSSTSTSALIGGAAAGALLTP